MIDISQGIIPLLESLQNKIDSLEAKIIELETKLQALQGAQ